MNRITLLFLVLFFTAIARLTLADDDDDGGDEEENTPKNGGSSGAKDTQCKCCVGSGVKCGQRLMYCGGGDDCHKDKLYFCDPKTKKAYIYEICQQRCLMDDDETYPDFCAISYDKDFIYLKEESIAKWRNNFNKTFDEYTKKFKKFEIGWNLRLPTEEEMRKEIERNKAMAEEEKNDKEEKKDDDKKDKKSKEKKEDNQVEDGEEE